MREILFRGKRADNGEWVEGFYVRLFEKVNGFYKAKHYVFDGNTKLGEERYCGHGNYEQDVKICKFEVVPETIGQYTGLTDKNLKKIWEGDIVKAKIIEFSGEKYIGIWEVDYHTKYGYFYLKKPENNLLFDGNWSYGVTKIEVIGNLHDNPELLKEGVEE